jgi:biotin transport system substrate-specific component
MSKKSLPLSQLTLAALFTALIAIMAQVAIPTPFSPVPFTGQVIGVMMTGALLEKKPAGLAVLSYLLIGAAGAPVFSMARGGIYMLIGPTGGYLSGFIPAVLLISAILGKIKKPSLLNYLAAMLPALILIYAIGASQLAFLMHYSINQALLIGVLPFIPLDLVKVAFAALLSQQIKKGLAANRPSHDLNDH